MIFFIPALVIAFATTSCNRSPGYEEAPLNGSGDIAIDIKTLAEKVPQFYAYVFNGRRINFFLVRINGDVESYFDACAMCYPKKMGYRVEGGEIICRACNLRYAIEELRTGKGSCHPIALPGRTENGFYIITKGDIKAGWGYF